MMIGDHGQAPDRHLIALAITIGKCDARQVVQCILERWRALAAQHVGRHDGDRLGQIPDGDKLRCAVSFGALAAIPGCVEEGDRRVLIRIVSVLAPRRHVPGILPEPFVRRRYAEELEKAQRDLFGER